jgi:hypothetical protein
MKGRARGVRKGLAAAVALFYFVVNPVSIDPVEGAGGSLVLRDVEVTAKPLMKATSERYVLEWTMSEAGNGAEEGAVLSAAPPPRARFALFQNHPNPFNPQTTISFVAPGTAGEKAHVSLGIYDLRGRLVRNLLNADMEAGSHQVVWEGRDERGNRVSSGAYLYRLQTEGQTVTRKMMVTK